MRDKVQRRDEGKESTNLEMIFRVVDLDKSIEIIFDLEREKAGGGFKS